MSSLLRQLILKSINLERIKKKAISAMKQSVRAFLPELVQMVDFNKSLTSGIEDQKFIAHLESPTTGYLEDEAAPGNSYLVLIGPEGGFSDDELSKAKENQFSVVKIGDYRLRTETAGIVGCTTLNQINH